MTFKEKVFEHYKEKVIRNIQAFQNILADLKESGANETKSTAGDKHETALAMLQIEQTNVRSQLKEAQEQLVQINKINPKISATVIVHGSLVKTNHGLFFIASALGKELIDGVEVIALSMQSPLGLKLRGLSAESSTVVNNKDFIVEELS